MPAEAVGHDGVVDDDGIRSGPITHSAERLEAFSDAVMAVVITLTALELKAPVGAGFSSLSHRLPTLLVYVLSFSFVGIYWNNHHHLFRATARIDGAVMWTNLLLLFWLSLIPVLTSWVGAEYRHPLPAASYGVVGIAAAASYTLLVRTIISANPSDSLVARALGDDRKGKVSLVLYAAAIPLALVTPWIAYALYASVSILWFIPDRRLTGDERPG